MMVDQTVKVWITKYALSAGIKVMQASLSNYDSSSATVLGRWGHVKHYFKPDWHTSFHGALARAEDMQARRIESQARKIASLRKALAKMEKMTFEGAG